MTPMHEASKRDTVQPSADQAKDLPAHSKVNGRNGHHSGEENRQTGGIVKWLRARFSTKPADAGLREVIEEIIGDAEDQQDDSAPITSHERALISNVLKFRDLTVVDVMIPRADIVAIDIDTSEENLLSLLAEKQFSRFPVYRETLDDVIGTIHIKDILACLTQKKPVNIQNLVREVPIVSPSMPVPDLILMMKQQRKHMSLVIDEYGGIDGLVTIGDVIEAIFGEVEDEHDVEDSPQFIWNDDGTISADARIDIEEFETLSGMKFLTEEEREDIDTIGGLIFAIAGHIPARGEIIPHPSGIVFEVLDADPRRVNQVLVRNTASPAATAE